MSKKAISFSVGSVLVLVLFGSLAEGGNVVVSPVNTVADLDLSGEVVYAINFGNNGTPKFGSFVFQDDSYYPGVTCVKTMELVITKWPGGIYPNTGDSELDRLLGGMIARNDGPGQCTTSVALGGLTVGMSYQLQIIYYDGLGHSRLADITVEGVKILESFDFFRAQGNVSGKGGGVVTYVFVAGDPTLNIAMTPIPNDGSTASGISGLIVTKLATLSSFADYGSGTTIELVSGKGTWQINWGQGPWIWSESTTAQPLLGSNVSSILAIQTTAPAKVSADLVATLPIAGTLTLSAHDQNNGNGVIGTMVLNCVGVNIVDLNAARVIVDQGSGMALAPFHPPGPEATATLKEATGVFAYVKQVGDWRLQLAGLYAMPLLKGVKLQDNIMQALGGKVPLVGGLGDFALSGQYEAVESLKPKAFCEYGMGVAPSFGAAGAVWHQSWGGGPWPWHKCSATVNAKFLGDNVSGKLETTTTGAPSVDEKMVLRAGFAGRLTLTKQGGVGPDGNAGQIIGDVKGTFVADANAVHSKLDAKGNIVCAFGVAVHNAPDAFVTVTKTSGVYADIHAAGDWAWYVNGTMTIARVATMSVQQNILAALQRPELLLGAQEEFVLTGWYYRK